MENSEIKKPNKYASLVTYLTAVVCLLLGLFLPMFNGNGILALCLPDAINRAAGTDIIETSKLFGIAFNADLFGTGVQADLLAYAVLIYTGVTALAVLALIPIGLTFNGNTKAPLVLEYIFTVAAVIATSLYPVLALQLLPETPISFNLIIAFGGPVLALMVLSCINKKASGASKTFLFLLSLIAVFLLFDISVIIPQIAGPLENVGASAGIFPGILRIFDKSVSGISYLTLLVAGPSGANFTTLFLSAETLAQKITCCVAVSAPIIILFNFYKDAISLSSNANKPELLFDIVRYALALFVFVLLIIMTAVSKYGFGLFTIIISAIALIQLLFSILRYIRYIKKVKEDKTDEDFANQTIKFAKPVKQPKPGPESDDVQDIPEVPSFVGAEPIVSEPIVAETIETNAEPGQTKQPEQQTEELISFIEPAPVNKEEEVYEEPVHEHPGEVQMEFEEVKPLDTPAEKPETFYIPDERPADNAEGSYDTQEPDEAEAEFEQSEEYALPVTDAVPVSYEEQPVYTEPAPEPVAEPEQTEEPEPVQPVYEEAPVQPVYYSEPVPEKQSAPEPAPASEPEEAPVQKVYYSEPVPEKQSAPAPAPAPARVNEVPVKIEIQPARPFIDKRIYSEMYEQTDSFMEKLTETEKIEFTRTFIEKANGDIGNIPEYVIGGSNKKFFSAVFIYLGRIRGLISDGLLNKMFKELNML